MELITVNNNIENQIISEQEIITPRSPFILSNTKEVSINHLKNDCIVPVFSKDMECTIAHHEFIEAVEESVQTIYEGQNISIPEQRVSHVVKGRAPQAIGKPVKDLLEHEKTVYYERMMLKLNIPSITADIGGNRLILSVAGVRAYNRENLYSKKSMEKFSVCVGFQNMVCTNLCINSDGIVQELRASTIEELKVKIMDLIGGYEMQNHINSLKLLSELKLNEQQFAKVLGKCRMYNYLPVHEKKGIPELLLNDGQINVVAKGYYEDENFAREVDGSISLWKVFNLLTGSVKSSYIDTFLSRSVNAHELVLSLANSMQNQTKNWFLN